MKNENPIVEIDVDVNQRDYDVKAKHWTFHRHLIVHAMNALHRARRTQESIALSLLYVDDGTEHRVIAKVLELGLWVKFEIIQDLGMPCQARYSRESKSVMP